MTAPRFFFLPSHKKLLLSDISRFVLQKLEATSNGIDNTQIEMVVSYGRQTLVLVLVCLVGYQDRSGKKHSPSGRRP